MTASCGVNLRPVPRGRHRVPAIRRGRGLVAREHEVIDAPSPTPLRDEIRAWLDALPRRP